MERKNGPDTIVTGNGSRETREFMMVCSTQHMYWSEAIWLQNDIKVVMILFCFIVSGIKLLQITFINIKLVNDPL